VGLIMVNKEIGRTKRDGGGKIEGSEVGVGAEVGWRGSGR
jgi:hypothetical protein